MSFNVPTAFLIFNRPDQTEQVFAEIARIRPKRLLVVADGPRNEAETEKCRAARAIVERVDWSCEVLKNYSELNLGCRKRVSSGLTWIFEQCEEAIILEDDCLPHPSFFPYCAELLEKYRDDHRVMMIGGNKIREGSVKDDSYYFSCFPHIWGWASWRRAWRHYDLDLKRWPELRETDFLFKVVENDKAVEGWRKIFDYCWQGKIDSWDYQLVFASWLQNALTIVPQRNLVSNIGYGEEATHTKDDPAGLSRMEAHEIAFPLRHPRAVERDKAADRRLMTSYVKPAAPPER
jgi:hypothetical protein